ncbi:MAG TPA: class I SAM-dependent methyltransferase, partial [Chloroflexota bacterium]|nr:class I SAM-dependent methyltransferase [Chloroflexota bacterium]
MRTPTPSQPPTEPRAARPKPAHHASEYGTWFQDPLVVEVYDRRPPYPQAAIDHLLALTARAGGSGPDTAVVLDLGAGTGDVARRLAPSVARVDAVDLSPGMIEKGK